MELIIKFLFQFIVQPMVQSSAQVLYSAAAILGSSVIYIHVHVLYIVLL